MILKTLAFLLLMYLLVKFISGLFLPSRNRRPSTFRVIYQTYKNIQKHQQQQQRRSGSRNPKDRFEEVEEAEFEEVDEEQSRSS